MQQISESELVLMKIIWKNGGTALYSYIMEELEKIIQTTENVKMILKTKKIGRRNEYAAVVTQQEYQTMQTHSFLDKVYGGDVKHLVSALVQQEMLSTEDLKEIETFWESQIGKETD